MSVGYFVEGCVVRKFVGNILSGGIVSRDEKSQNLHIHDKAIILPNKMKIMKWVGGIKTWKYNPEDNRSLKAHKNQEPENGDTVNRFIKGRFTPE